MTDLDRRTAVARHLAEADVALDAVNGDFIHDMGLYSAIQAVKALRYAIAELAGQVAEQLDDATSAHVSTTQAADLLGVSRPTIVRYLEDGRIPYTKPGKHRRLQLADVLEFKKTITHDRHQPLTEQPIDRIPTQRGINYLRDRREQHPRLQT